MGQTAMIPDSQEHQARRGPARLGAGGGIIAVGRGLVFVTERAMAKHTASIFLKLGLQPSDDDNRRVLAVLACLGR